MNRRIYQCFNVDDMNIHALIALIPVHLYSTKEIHSRVIVTKCCRVGLTPMVIRRQRTADVDIESTLPTIIKTRVLINILILQYIVAALLETHPYDRIPYK